ncbi:hypothetical protein HEP87_09265 [Streptomyces sp. S1D4-11]|nr:hypothetical protein [Streptomyces sp. S1D4-11]QIY94195.1 hypothetical protein HEP87_09265 [Streptomyces sp. S1D4-11]
MTENSDTVDAELVDGSLPAVATAAAVSLHTARDHEVSDVTRQALEDSIADNTRRTYDRQWNTFTTWCATEQRVALPATPKRLLEYVRYPTRTLSARTGRTPARSSIEQAIAVIRVAHKAAGHRDQPDTAAALRVLRPCKKKRSEAGTRKRKSPPINLAKLRLLVADWTQRRSPACATASSSSWASP